MRILAFVIGAGLIMLGGVAFLGAMELWRGGASTEELAQGFLVSASLVLIGGFVIWIGLKRREG